MASTTYEQPPRYYYDQRVYPILLSAAHDHFVDVNKIVRPDHFATLGNMVRNSGQLPQPFWLGAARGGGSCSAARCAART